MTYSLETFTLPKSKKAKYQAQQKLKQSRYHRTAGDFRCVRCRQLVTAAAVISGVKNRNHCPYCLWSRHLDLLEAGDRLAACKASMKPVGVTLKKTHNKYRDAMGGELMLVHLCTECGKASINRIAADDDAQMIYQIYESSLDMSEETRKELAESGIATLEAADAALVAARLFGRRVLARAEHQHD